MSPSAVPALAPVRRGPFRLAIAIVVVATIVILKGAMTTSTGSGLAYPDYPLSDGQLMPASAYTTVAGFLEHFHRLWAGTAGVLALWLALWLQFGGGMEGAPRRTAWFGGCLLLAQGLFGGIGVLLKLPPETSVVHATLAQLTLATFACLAYRLSERWRDTPRAADVPTGAGRGIAVAAVVIVVVQTVVGALARHTNSPHALWTHVGNALVVFLAATIATAFALGRLGDTPGVKGLARTIVTLLIVQIALGFVVLAIRNPAGKTPENVRDLGTAFTISVHVLLGALLTVLMATLAAHVYRATRAPGPGPA
ncbi:MAG: COX15/CtaA family protein [Planctomycetota bacterium]